MQGQSSSIEPSQSSSAPFPHDSSNGFTRPLHSVNKPSLHSCVPEVHMPMPIPHFFVCFSSQEQPSSIEPSLSLSMSSHISFSGLITFSQMLNIESPSNNLSVHVLWP